MMIKALIHIGVIAGTLLLISQYVPGIAVSSIYTALIVAILWGVIGWTLKPLLNIVALPINLLTLGLFSFIINALLFWFLSTFISGFSVDGFLPALEGSFLLSVVAWALHAAL